MTRPVNAGAPYSTKTGNRVPLHSPGGLLLRDVEHEGRRVDVRIDEARITAIGPELPTRAGDHDLPGRGGALIPGLHDHHLHLLALAAALDSVRLGPPEVHDPAGFATALTGAARTTGPGGWLRGVGYHESVAGPLDRWRLDAIVADRPVRVQDRSGTQWTVNSMAVRDLGLDTATEPGIERDPTGTPTGRLTRLDDWLRVRLPPRTPDLGRVGALLAGFGVTGVTDATPFREPASLAVLAAAVGSGALPQRVVVTGGPELADAPVPAVLGVGPVKVVLAEPDLPGLDEVAGWFASAHAAGRAVAVHCVTRAALVLALAAWDAVGPWRTDRIEHAAVVPPELVTLVRRAGVTVVTQPNFIAERGDRYLAEVEPADRPHLYPCASLLNDDIPVGAGTDAPFGHPDPWAAIRAAVDRRTVAGAVLGGAERIPPARALELFLTSQRRPGGPPRTVAIGRFADLVLLDAGLADVLADPDHRHVAATIRGGEVIHRRPT